MKNLLIKILISLIGIYAQELILVIEHYNSGNIYSITYHKPTLTGNKGEIHGLRTWFYDNQQLKIESHYNKGNKDGLWTHWYENGQRKNEGNYINGRKEGIWTSWYRNGKIQMEVMYKYGKIISNICWDDSGNQISCK